MSTKEPIRVIVGMEGGVYCGHSSSEHVDLTVIDHDILSDIDPHPEDLKEYHKLVSELDNLPYDANGLKKGRT